MSLFSSGLFFGSFSVLSVFLLLFLLLLGGVFAGLSGFSLGGGVFLLFAFWFDFLLLVDLLPAAGAGPLSEPADESVGLTGVELIALVDGD